MMHRTLRSLVIFALFCGCSDEVGAPAQTASLGGEMGVGGSMDDVMAPSLEEATGGVEEFVRQPAYIEVKLNPRPRSPLTVYTLEDTPAIEITVYGEDGEVLPEQAVVLDVVDPNGDSALGPPARISDDRVLTFLREGPGAVRARLPGEGCSTGADLCGRANFFVDAAEPLLEVIEPQRGAIVDGILQEGVFPTIRVAGRTDADGQTRVFVNDTEAAIAADGSFSTDVPAQFGLNRIDVVADDGVRRPPVRMIRDVIWAEKILAPDEETYEIPSSLILRFGQNAFDGDADVVESEDDGSVEAGDVAALVEALLQRADLIGILREALPGGEVESSDDFSLVISNIAPGTPNIVVTFTEQGLEVFVRIDGLMVETTGRLDEYVLDGDITMSVAAVVQLALSGITNENGAYDLTVSAAASPGSPGGGTNCPEVALAIEALEPRMLDPAVNGLLGVLSNPARALVEGSVQNVICRLLRQRLPEFFEVGLDETFSSLRSSNIGTEANEFLPETSLELGLTLARHEVQERNSLTLIFDGTARQTARREAPHISPGVPSHDYTQTPEPLWPPNSDGAIAMKLNLMNSVLESLWRQGILKFRMEGETAGELPGIRSVSLDGQLPPVLAPTPVGHPHPVELQIGDLELALNSILDGPDVPPDIYSLSLRTGIDFDLQSGGITVRIADEVDARFEVLEVGGERLFLDTATLGTLFGAAIWPQLKSELGELLGLQIPPIRLDVQSIASLTNGVEAIEVKPEFPYPAVVSGGWLVINAELIYLVE